MEASRQQSVLAVGIHSGEPTLVRSLIDRGELPALGSLLERGEWALVDSRTDIGSGAVWPTFFTGTDPTEHGMHSSWLWRPDQMACSAVHDGFFPSPFWRQLRDRGESVGVLDVPWAPFERIARGFEVSEFGPLDGGHGKPRASPSRVEQIVRGERHPFYDVPFGPGFAEEQKGKERLSSACFAGARLRGELAVRLISEALPALSIVVFTETHHTAHELWRTVEPEHPLYADHPVPPDKVKPGLVDLYREVDRQIGRLVEAAGPGTAVMAFSLHGMRPGPGLPTVLGPLLELNGFAAPSRWRGLSWRDRGASLLGAAKRRAPASLRRLYYRRTAFRTRHRVAQPTIVAPHEWSRTRAFSLPTDERGYVRVNLAGREAKGIVHRRDYGAICDHLTEVLRAAEDIDGKPLVRSVLRTAAEGAGPPEHLPDLIIDWGDAAFARPVRGTVGSVEFEAYPIRTDITGRHALRGFCILDERLADGSVGELIAGKDLHRPLLSALGVQPAQATG
jgi:predicted AlkP superfamily phosphohydrolase/phosphomutase